MSCSGSVRKTKRNKCIMYLMYSNINIDTEQKIDFQHQRENKNVLRTPIMHKRTSTIVLATLLNIPLVYSSR